MNEIEKILNIKIDENILIHKIQHSFITKKNNKENELKGNTEYIIIDQTGQKEPKTISIKE